MLSIQAPEKDRKPSGFSALMNHNVFLGGNTMYNLKAEYRDQNAKAKQLRRAGIVPACIYGVNLEESILLQIPLADTIRFLNEKSKGTTLAIAVGRKKHNVLFKEITREPVSGQVEHLEFQSLVSDEAINSVAQVVLINKDKNQNIIQQHIEEIPHTALPKHLVESVTIDLDGMPAGTTVKVEDLDIAKNKNVKLLIGEDTMVINIIDRSKTGPAVQEEPEAEAEE